MQELGTAAEAYPQQLLGVLAADRAAGLLGGPGRERAPVGTGPGAASDRLREPPIAVRDLEVAQDRIVHRGDPPHLRRFGRLAELRCLHGRRFSWRPYCASARALGRTSWPRLPVWEEVTERG